LRPWRRDLAQRGQRHVHRGQVPGHHLLALAAVALLDRLLDPLHRPVARQHAGDGKEAGLQHGVDQAAQPGLARDPGGVDHEQA